MFGWTLIRLGSCRMLKTVVYKISTKLRKLIFDFENRKNGFCLIRLHYSGGVQKYQNRFCTSTDFVTYYKNHFLLIIELLLIQ